MQKDKDDLSRLLVYMIRSDVNPTTREENNIKIK